MPRSILEYRGLLGSMQSMQTIRNTLYDSEYAEYVEYTGLHGGRSGTWEHAGAHRRGRGHVGIRGVYKVHGVLGSMREHVEREEHV